MMTMGEISQHIAAIWPSGAVPRDYIQQAIDNRLVTVAPPAKHPPLPARARSDRRQQIGVRLPL